MGIEIIAEAQEMAVSLTQVQPALHGLPNGGGQGQLTLNVLNKTEALLAQLLALDPKKNHSVEVLKAQANGRSEVLVGALKLDVKASLPLKAGEVFQLKFEQVGSALRFVQPIAADTQPKGQKTHTNAQTGEKAAKGPGGQPAAQLAHGAKGGARGDGGVPAQQLKSSGISQLKSAQHASSETNQHAGKRSGPSEGAVLNGAKGQAVSLQKVAGGQALRANVYSQTGRLNEGGTAQNAARGAVSGAHLTSLSVSPRLASQNTTTALLRAVTEILPELSGKGAGSALKPSSQLAQGAGLKGQGAPGQGTTGQAAQSQGPGFVSKGLPGGRLAGGVQASSTAGSSASASEVSASYKLAAQSAGEEGLDPKPQVMRAADLSTEISFDPARSPLMIWLQYDREAKHQTGEGEETGIGLRFTFETEETGAIHAELSYVNEVVRMGIWANRAEMADKIKSNLKSLETRLEAKGLRVGGLYVRHGSAPPKTIDEIIHVDEEI